MKKPRLQTRNDIIRLSAAALSVLILLIINSQLTDTGSVTAITSGIMFYFCYLKLNTADMRYPADFIQSGEASPGLITGTISLHLNTSALLSGIFMLPVFMVTTIFQKLVLKRDRREILMNGFFLNIIFLLVIFFLHTRDSSFNIDTITSLLTGLLNTGTGLITASFAFAASAACVLLIIAAGPELVLFSHGKNMFRKTGFDYSKASFGLTLLRAFFLCMAILFAGFFAGSGLYFQMQKRSGCRQDIFHLFICIVCSQLLLLLLVFAGPCATVITSVLISYILYFICNGVKHAVSK